jgi:hypothetical protein
MYRHLPLTVMAMIVLLGAAGAQVKREPAMGAMREGEVVLVDDGTCPKGRSNGLLEGTTLKLAATNK